MPSKQQVLFGEPMGNRVCPVCGEHEPNGDALTTVEPCGKWLCKIEYSRLKKIQQNEQVLTGVAK